MFNPDKKQGGVVSKNKLEVSRLMEAPLGSKRYVCVGVYIDENDQEQLFIPKINFSVFHGDQELIGDVDTIGFADIPVGQLPESGGGSTGFATDERGQYIYYTAKDGKQVKIYHNADSLVPPGAKAYKVVNGFLPNDSIMQFSSIGMSSRSMDEGLLSNKIDPEVLKLLS